MWQVSFPCLHLYLIFVWVIGDNYLLSYNNTLANFNQHVSRLCFEQKHCIWFCWTNMVRNCTSFNYFCSNPVRSCTSFCCPFFPFAQNFGFIWVNSRRICFCCIFLIIHGNPSHFQRGFYWWLSFTVVHYHCCINSTGAENSGHHHSNVFINLLKVKYVIVYIQTQVMISTHFQFKWLLG